MDYDVANECTTLSDQEKITFPEVVRRLMDAGIELYYADLLHGSKTYYAGNRAHQIDCLKKYEKAADSFNQLALIRAIKQIQSGEIKYQEFIRKIMDAGVICYLVFVKGRKAIYFGRNGEQHIEEFLK